MIKNVGYIQQSEFRANSVFQGKRKLLKILNDKKYIVNTVNSGQTLSFIRQFHRTNMYGITGVIDKPPLGNLL